MHEVLVASLQTMALRQASAAERWFVVLQGVIRTHGDGRAFMPLANLTSDLVNGKDDAIDGHKAAAEATGWILSHVSVAQLLGSP